MLKTFGDRKSGQSRLGHSDCGQATVEYAIVTGILIALVVIMALLLTTFNNYGERLLTIIASDYP